VPRAFNFDTDTASDDAVALIMALRAPDVRVVAITTVAGNVDVAQSTRNALYTVELAEPTSQYIRSGQAPASYLSNATWFHGRDGLGDHNYPPPRRSPEIYTLRTRSSRPSKPIPELYSSLAPLTNVAPALAKRPGHRGQGGPVRGYGWGTVLRKAT